MSLDRGLFIDLDGTLANSLPVMRLAYDQFLARFDKLGNDIEFGEINGPPLSKIVEILADTHSLPGTTHDLMSAYKAIIALVYKSVQPNEGAMELLHSAKAQGYKVGVVTSNSAKLTTDWLQRVGIYKLLDTLVTGEQVSQGKPNPEPYLTALEKTGCVAHRSFAVEDSFMGVRASVDAGLNTFHLSNASTNKKYVGVTTVSKLSDLITLLPGKQS